ncbi:unnamed protein product [Cylicocyclus nassatus]|uniref:Phospholipid/glycerol acyltransferase domain-containing protein n=1 Tax=Cylicocyclus nassatus TaxID=53992 RepID=A0AA36DMH8_CYLNA|nr:unnamed protein product [Cylicocyclus nassatus]
MGAGEPPVLAAGQPLWVRLRGWSFCAFTLISALLGSIYIITPLLPLIFINPKMWRKCMDRLIGIWVVMPGSLMSYVFGAKIHVRGDMIDHSKPAVMIMNHRSRLDWLYFWNALFKMDPWLCTSEKIVLKGILKYVPGAGWAMACNSYIYLDRSFDTDETRLNNILDYYARCGFNYQILFYPEGTDKCPLATERSRKYAEKNELVHYEYVLHPRTTGFVHMIQNMRRAGYIDSIYDVTIGYNDCIVQSEVHFAAYGVCPKDVHYQVRKIKISDLPEDDKGLSQWLINLWKEKEEKLRRFYLMDPKSREFDNTPNGKDYEPSTQTFIAQVIINVFWIATTIMWMYGFAKIPYMCSFAMFSSMIFFYIQRRWGGVEWLAIEKFNEVEKVKSI